MAPVKVLASYRVYNTRPSVLENLLHRVFASVRLSLTQIDAHGETYDPKEWFVAPLPVIEQAIEMIISGDIVNFSYDRDAQALVYNPVGRTT